MNASETLNQNVIELLDKQFKVQCNQLRKWILDSLEKHKKITEWDLKHRGIIIDVIYEVKYVDKRLNLYHRVDFMAVVNDVARPITKMILQEIEEVYEYVGAK